MNVTTDTREPELELNDVLVWLVATALFVVADVTVTLFALDAGYVEANPLYRLSIAAFGPLSLFALKFVGMVALVLLWSRMDAHARVVPYWTAFAGFVLVTWNVAVLFGWFA